MYKELADYRSPSFNDSYTITKIDEGDDICEWIDLVEVGLFNGNKLNFRIFEDLIKAKKVTLIALRDTGNVVGTIMIHWAEQSAGIYMVCTKKEFRSKGIGKRLLDYSLREILNSNGKFCVLQSTYEGVVLYEKMNFKREEVINLYWKVK